MVSLEHAQASQTRALLLQAALQTFAEVGYAQAAIADIVARASSSVGSLYHHFGGKADLFLALYHDYQQRQLERAEEAVRDARAGDERDPVALFVAGARAYLQGAWLERDVARMVLASGDTPPGFELVHRVGFADWVRRSHTVLGGNGQPAGPEAARAHAVVLTAAIGAGAGEVAGEPDQQRAMALADEVLKLVGKLAS